MNNKRYFSNLKKTKVENELSYLNGKLKKILQKSTSMNKSLKNILKAGWKIEDNSLVKIFRTKSFPETLGLVMSIGALCQQFDHHPDYLTMKYAEVKVSFSTHSEGGKITEKDIIIAKEIDKIFTKS
jgi:4a-hydroxytetrahydrobiopterin dehydratase